MKTLVDVALIGLLALASLGVAHAEDSRPQLDQDVIKSSVTIGSILIGQSFVPVSSATMTGSWLVEVQNLSTEQICCSFDSAATTATSSGKSCARIDTASTAARPTSTDWKRWKFWSQNLALYCRSMKSSGNAEIIVTQGK